MNLHADTYPNTQRGATRQSRRSPTPVALLKGLMDGRTDPHDPETREAIRVECIEMIMKDTALNETALEYWFVNWYRALLHEYPKAPPSTPARATRRAARDQAKSEFVGKVNAAVERRAESMLLDWVLPNDKALRDCTGRECKAMSHKIGPWLAKIAARVKPDQIVGDVLQEADVRKLYGRPA